MTMDKERIAYRSGYHYQLYEDYEIRIDICLSYPIETDFVSLFPDGLLLIKKGYAWDGASGPAMDTKTIMRGSLVHDALYQLMREDYLYRERSRDAADRLLQKICIEDGMCKLRAWWVYQAVKRFADPYADPKNSKPVLQAPQSKGDLPPAKAGGFLGQ